jgi:hypothetical protein
MGWAMSTTVTDTEAARTRKRGRRPVQEGQAAAEVEAPRQRGEATQPSTLPEAKRDQTETAKTAAIVTTTSRKRAKLLRMEKRAEERAVDTGTDPEATARVKAFLARMIRPGGPLPPPKR